MHASKRSEFIACAACEIPQQISFYLHVRETLLELSPLKAALPLLIASAVTGLAPACCFALCGAEAEFLGSLYLVSLIVSLGLAWHLVDSGGENHDLTIVPRTTSHTQKLTSLWFVAEKTVTVTVNVICKM